MSRSSRSQPVPGKFDSITCCQTDDRQLVATPRSPTAPARRRTPSCPRVKTVPEKSRSSGTSPSRSACRYFDPVTSKSYVHGQRQVDLGRPGEALHHRASSASRGTAGASPRQRLAVAEQVEQLGLLGVARSGRRCGSIRTWQRSAMACTVAPVVSSIRSRAVSCGAAAYGSATMSSDGERQAGHRRTGHRSAPAGPAAADGGEELVDGLPGLAAAVEAAPEQPQPADQLVAGVDRHQVAGELDPAAVRSARGQQRLDVGPQQVELAGWRRRSATQAPSGSSDSVAPAGPG